MRKITTLLLFTVAIVTSISAQNIESTKKWEFGLGGSVYQFSRTSFSNFTKMDNGYHFDLSLKQALFGGNIYVAKELNTHLYLDLQGTVGVTNQALHNDNKTKWLYTAGLGLQWRFGDYFRSGNIDPYLRVGAGYMYKEFSINYTGTEGLSPVEMEWVQKNMSNKDGADRAHIIPVALGAGVNLWLNDKWGIGIQGDYLVMPYKNVANSLQGTVRVIYRLGGSRKSDRFISKVDCAEPIAPKEKIVEIQVEKIVEKEVVREVFKMLFIENINFHFDDGAITAESDETLNGIAAYLKGDTSKRYLITGYTDAKGGDKYNEELSDKRAEVVVKALVDRGVPGQMLKKRGVGKKIAFIQSTAPEKTREGDRKITIELINNIYYWNQLP